MPNLTIEQQQAIAIAKARRRQTESTANQQPEERSTLDNIGRGIGLTARNVLKVPGAVADFGAGVINVADRGLQNVFGFDNPPLLPSNNAEFIDEKLTEAGLPVEETGLERVGSDIQNAAMFAATPIKGGAALKSSANPVTRGVGETLTAGPAMQGASAATGAGASGTVREQGGTPGQQVAAGLAGAFSPSAVQAGGGALLRGVRGSSGETVARNVETFARAGTTPTLGQATESRALQAVESFLSRSPGSSGVMIRKANQLSDDVAAIIEKRASELARKATPERAGAAIVKGVKGSKGFIEQRQAVASKLYNLVDEHLDTAATVSARNTEGFLSNASAPVLGAENTSELLSGGLVRQLGKALTQDLDEAVKSGGVRGLPYEALKAIRTRVGERINNLTLVTDASKGELKQLYGAISKDLTEAAAATGNPQALQAARRADNFYRAFRTRVDNIESVVQKNGGAEKVFNAALAGTKDGATTLRTVMKSINAEERQMLTAAVIRRMGKSTPGQQNASTSSFSIETYLTNWARLSPEARGTLFGTHGPKFRKDMQALADVASNVRDGSRVFSNPSGTQQALTLQTTTGGALLSAVMGRMDVAAGIGSGIAIANLGARLLTNPTFVARLSTATRAPAGSVPAVLSAFVREFEGSDDLDLSVAAIILKDSLDKESANENQPADN